MNALLWIANYLHLLTIAVLLVNIWRTKNCVGISAKSQLLYILVFTPRYLDEFTICILTENIVSKIFYVGITFLILSSMIIFFWETYEKKFDTARVGLLIISCIVIAMLINHKFTFMQILWTFSIHLEAVAMVPQYQFVIESKQIHAHIVGYIAAIAIYRALYIANWAYRYNTEGHYDKIALTAGIIQFILNCDFFLQILPRLCTCKNVKQSNVSEVEILVDREVPKAGHLVSNVSAIVLTPASLTEFYDDKVKVPLTTEKAAEK